MSEVDRQIAKHNRSLVHYGKYVFDPMTFLPIRLGERKPYHFLPVEAFCDQLQRDVRLVRLDEADGLTGSFVMSIRSGWCHGRHCDWVGLGECALEDVRYLDGCLRPNAFPLGRLNPRYWRRRLTTPTRFPRPMKIGGRVIVLNKVASHNYFHWLSEVLPRLELVRRAGFDQADAYVVDCQQAFQRRSLELLGVPMNRIIQPHNGSLVRADELVVPSFTSAEARRRLGNKLGTSVGLNDGGEATVNSSLRKIYVSRRNSAKRRLHNEAEVSSLLQTLGFETHCLEKDSFDDQVRLFRDASVVVGLHGAGLTNAMLCHSTTHLVEIRPSDCRRECFAQLASELGMPFQMVTAKRLKRRGPIICPLEELEHAVGLSTVFQTPRRAG